MFNKRRFIIELFLFCLLLTAAYMFYYYLNNDFGKAFSAMNLNQETQNTIADSTKNAAQQKGFSLPRSVLEEIADLQKRLRVSTQQDKSYKWLITQLSQEGCWKASSGRKEEDVELTAVACISLAQSVLFKQFPNQVKPPIKWLVEQQNADGSYGADTYQTALAVWALSSVYFDTRCMAGIRSKVLWAIINGVKWGVNAQLKNGGWPGKSGDAEADDFATFCWARALREAPRQISGGEEGACVAAITGVEIPPSTFKALADYAEQKAKEIYEGSSAIAIDKNVRPSVKMLLNWLLTFYRYKEFNDMEKKMSVSLINGMATALKNDDVTAEVVGKWGWFYCSTIERDLGLRGNVLSDDSLDLAKTVHERLVLLMHPDGYWKFPPITTAVKRYAYERETIGQTALAALCAQTYSNYLGARISDLYCIGMNKQNRTDDSGEKKKDEAVEKKKADDF